MRTLKTTNAILLLATVMLAGCRSSVMMEYFFEHDINEDEIRYEQLPERVQEYHEVCHTPGDIKGIYVGQLSLYNKKAYKIAFTDGGEMLFDKRGRCIFMENWKDGLPDCWTSQIPIYDALYMTITLQMADLNPDSKPWNIRCLEIHPNCYLVKAGIGEDIYQFMFDKKGKLLGIGIEI